MKHNRFKGVGVALVTPFRDGKIDFDALEKVIEHVIAGGVDYLVSLGTTGESVTLDQEEKHAVLDFTIKVNAGRLPIVAGFGGNDTRQLIKEIQAYHFKGIDAILSSSPAYNKPTQEGIYQHYMKLDAESPRPIIAYNVPGRTSSNITADTMLALAHDSKNIFAVKEASADMSQGAAIIKHRPKDFLVISGDDPTALPLVSMGGDGVISVIANALPKEFCPAIQSALQGDFKTAAKHHIQLSGVHKWLYADGNPAGVKAAMEMMGICSRETRLPLVPVGKKVYEGLKNELIDLGIIVPDDAIA